ncbi:MAG: aldehyde dehydrogenase family protein, partial [Chloroflexi bacterium]|nr:aldehyde dehydrogenase family protein [Chloroflexota bacterium]
MMTYKNYIDGKWVEGKNGAKYASLNPANEEIVGEISQAEVSDVEAAVEAASRAFN